MWLHSQWWHVSLDPEDLTFEQKSYFFSNFTLIFYYLLLFLHEIVYLTCVSGNEQKPCFLHHQFSYLFFSSAYTWRTNRTSDPLCVYVTLFNSLREFVLFIIYLTFMCSYFFKISNLFFAYTLNILFSLLRINKSYFWYFEYQTILSEF